MTKDITDFRERRLVFVDLETTGLDVKKHEIIEVASLVCDGETLKILKEFETKVRPKHIETADPFALKINGYKEETWEEAVELTEALIEVSQLAPGGMVAGWNVAFDWEFLEKGFKEKGIPHQFDYHKIDAMSVAYSHFYPKREVKELGLRKIAPLFDIELGKTHSAMEDIRATYEIFKRILKGR